MRDLLSTTARISTHQPISWMNEAIRLAKIETTMAYRHCSPADRLRGTNEGDGLMVRDIPTLCTTLK